LLDRRFLDVSLVVAGIANSPAASPTAGTQYIVGSSPAGDFSGASANQLARYDGSKWIFSTPKANGLEVLNAETKEVLSFDGTEWTVKATLAQAKSNENFAVVDYFADKSHYYEPSVMTGYTPGEFLGVYYGNDNKKLFGFMYQADLEGTLKKVEKTDIVGKTILIIKNDNTDLNVVLSPYVNIITDDLPDTNNICFKLSRPDLVFCKQTGHFYKYDKTADNYVDLGAVSTLDFAEISNGVFLYYAETNSFYYVDTENNKFAVIPLATSGGATTTSEFIVPVLDIVQKGEHSNPPRPVAGLKFIDVNEGSAFAYDDSLNLRSITLTNGDRYALTTDFKIYEYDGTTWTATDVPDGGIFLNKADNYVYVYDAKAGAFVKASVDTVSGAGDEVICENHTLTAEEATAKSFTLANSIKSGKETGVLLSVCGMIQIAGVDYTASGNTISWTGKTLDDIGLQAGDIFVVQYVKG